jgi:hypothetical protein
MALIARLSTGDWNQRLRSIATIRPTTPMIRNVPKPERSRFVV